jgi:hypothetical protein
MRHALKITSLTFVLAATGALGASAAPARGTSTAPPSLIEQTQFFWNGNEFCFYDDGWRGPGWYICGYEWRRGYGWGGGREWGRRFRDEGRRYHEDDRREYREEPRDHHDMDRRRDEDHHEMRGGEGGMRGGERDHEGGMR